MSGPSIIRCVLLAWLCSAQASAIAQDAVGSWLEDIGLDRLHARRLEQQLDSQRDTNIRATIARKLAGTYSILLESTPSGDVRDVLEARGRGVLTKISDEDGDPLRLALLRSSYAVTSRECEFHRLALESGSTIGELQERLAALVTNLSQVRSRLERRERALERRVNRSRGVDAQIASVKSDEVALHISQSTFLEAWSRAYLAWLSGGEDMALEAQKLFGVLLATGDAFPDPNDVSLDLRDDEIYAESILGMAFAKSVTDSVATVEAWLDLLDDPTTAEYVRRNLPYWEIALHAQAGGFGETLQLLRELPDDAPTSWLRLAAVSGLAARGGGSAAQALGTEAVALLAARNELAQVVDLAERFGLADMERDGFALYYVSGVCRYEDGRKASDRGDLSAAQQSYRAALEDLDSAAAEPDAGNYEDALPGVQSMRAWCLHEIGDHARASVLFEEAADLHGGVEAGNLLWMAISTLDELERDGGGGSDLQQRRMTLIDRFLEDHPSHPSAPGALLRRLASNPTPTLEDAELLVSASTNSPLGIRAHQEGVQMLYRIFRRSKQEDRATAGKRFIEVVPVPRFDPEDDKQVHLVDVIRARQLLDVALSPGILEVALAESIVDAIDRGVNAGVIDITGKERELDYRRLQIALHREDIPEAVRIFRMFETDQVDDWSKLAARTLFKAASVAVQREDLASDDMRTQSGIDAVRRSAVILLGDPPEQADFTVSGNWTVARLLAIAEHRAYEANGSLETRDRALELYALLAQFQGKDEVILEGLAALSEEADLHEQALEVLRTLVAGTQTGSDTWYRRKADLVRVLSVVDPERARAVLDQHAALHPDYGPDPWGPAMRQMHVRLGGGGGAS